MPDDGFDWAHRFDDAADEQLGVTPGEVVNLVNHPDYKLAVPTLEHFIPMLYLAGRAAGDGASVSPILRRYPLIPIMYRGAFSPSSIEYLPFAQIT